MKQKLVKCAPRAYSELIRLDIPGSSGARPARLPFLRSSPLYVIKMSRPQIFLTVCFGAPYCEAYTGKALVPLGGAGKEEEERETETFELARELPSCSGQDPTMLGLESHVAGLRSPSYNAGRGDGESRSP